MKAYIFDQDRTLYSETNPITQTLREKGKRLIMKAVNLDATQIDDFYADLSRKYPNPFDGIISCGLSIEYYHSNVFDSTDPALYLSRDEVLREILCSLRQPKYVVTFASKYYSHCLQDTIGVLDLIDYTIFVSDLFPETSKAAAYRLILEKNNLRPEDVCVVGDNFDNDIVPALQLGCRVVLVGKEDHNVPKIDNIYRFEG